MMAKSIMVRTQIQLTKEQAQRLKAAARRSRLSVSELIRRGVFARRLVTLGFRQFQEQNVERPRGAQNRRLSCDTTDRQKPAEGSPVRAANSCGV